MVQLEKCSMISNKVFFFFFSKSIFLPAGSAAAHGFSLFLLSNCMSPESFSSKVTQNFKSRARGLKKEAERSYLNLQTADLHYKE